MNGHSQLWTKIHGTLIAYCVAKLHVHKQENKNQFLPKSIQYKALSHNLTSDNATQLTRICQ